MSLEAGAFIVIIGSHSKTLKGNRVARRRKARSTLWRQRIVSSGGSGTALVIGIASAVLPGPGRPSCGGQALLRRTSPPAADGPSYGERAFLRRAGRRGELVGRDILGALAPLRATRRAASRPQVRRADCL